MAVNEQMRIANRQVKVKARGQNGDGKTGTRVKPSYGASLGMKPDAFSTFKAIAGQKVKDKVPSKQGEERKAGEPGKEEKLVEQAKKRFAMAAEAEASNRKVALEDLEFFAGKQWDDTIARQRQMDGRPCLTINRLPQFVRQVTNEQRQNRPSIQVNPVDDGADPKTAEILQGIIRHIEYQSGADAAYDTAFFGAAAFSFGYFRVTTEYSGPVSFDQEIRIKRIRNPFTVYYDPAAKEADYSDAEWAFIIEKMSKDAYRKAYPKSELAQMEDWQSIGDTNSDWIQEDQVRVVEYFRRETEYETLLMLTDGSVMLQSKFDELAEQLGISEEQKAALIRTSRETEIQKVKWAKINGLEILDETDWAGQWIPIIKVVGDELDIDGKLLLKGIVRDAKEPQRQFNFMKSAATEAIALAPKAPFVIAEGQLEGYERQWAQANTKSFAYLQYKPTTVGGQAAPPPQRMNAEPAIQAINMAMMESTDDLKSVTGIYDASLGAQGNETSGRAILARQQQGQSSNFHYIDNLTRAIRHCGRILLDLIPKIYDTPRVIRILGEDGSTKFAAIGQEDQLTPEQAQAWQQYERIYDLNVGTYDVTISTGPSYQSKRQEAVTSIVDLTKSYPALMGVAGDILVKNMDWPGAQEIAKRLHATLPPQIAQADGGGGEQQIPPELQQALAQQTETIQKLTQELQATQQELQTGITIKQMELRSKEMIAAGDQRIRELELQLESERIQIDAMKANGTLVQGLAKIDAAAAENAAQRTFQRTQQLSDQVHQASIEQMRQDHSMETIAAQPQPVPGNEQAPEGEQ